MYHQMQCAQLSKSFQRRQTEWEWRSLTEWGFGENIVMKPILLFFYIKSMKTASLSSLTIFSISCFNYLLWCYRIYYCNKYTQTHLRKGRLSLRVSNLLKAQISRDLEIPTARSLLVSSFLRLLHSLFCRLSSFFYEVKVFGFSCIVWDCH